MRETFVIRLKEACGVSPGEHVLVAVSGGADSTALLCLFDEIRGSVSASNLLCTRRARHSRRSLGGGYALCGGAVRTKEHTVLRQSGGCNGLCQGT